MVRPIERLKRRRFLAIAGGTATLLGLVIAVPSLRGGGKAPAADGLAGDASATSPATIATTVEFLGSLFGRPLTEEDRFELRDRLSYASNVDVDLGQQFAFLARHLDQCAIAADRVAFAHCTADQQFAVVDSVMRLNLQALPSRVLWRFSAAERNRRRMRAETIPRLALLYRSSGVPWRARGYSRWPGIPGAWDEYTRPGKPYPNG